jgi:hypothetical protein
MPKIVYELGNGSVHRLRADYVRNAWSAMERILPATEEQIAALPEFNPKKLHGGRVSGYLNYWVKQGFLIRKTLP